MNAVHLFRHVEDRTREENFSYFCFGDGCLVLSLLGLAFSIPKLTEIKMQRGSKEQPREDCQSLQQLHLTNSRYFNLTLWPPKPQRS